jgi:phage shock protein C
MFCTRCGTKLDDAARFCTRCGAPTTAICVPAPFETKKLRRILQGKKIAGVCAGYAEYFNMDVTLMRVIWVGLLLVPPNIGLIAYIVSWIVLPKE